MKQHVMGCAQGKRNPDVTFIYLLGCALRVLASACVILLWWFVLRSLCVCLCNMIVGVDMYYFPLGCIVGICRA